MQTSLDAMEHGHVRGAQCWNLLQHDDGRLVCALISATVCSSRHGRLRRSKIAGGNFTIACSRTCECEEAEGGQEPRQDGVEGERPNQQHVHELRRGTRVTGWSATDMAVRQIQQRVRASGCNVCWVQGRVCASRHLLLQWNEVRYTPVSRRSRGRR